MFKLSGSLKDEFKVVISSNKNYSNYNIISSYPTFEEAKNNMDKDISKYRIHNYDWWKMSNQKYHAVIKEYNQAI